MRKLLFIIMITLLFIACKEEKKIVVGTSRKDMPYSYVENGVLKGFDVELINEISKETGIKVKWNIYNENELLDALKKNKIDMLISGFSKSEKASEYIDLSIPYTEPSSMILTQDIHGISKKEDIEGKKIGVQVGVIKKAEIIKLKPAKVKVFISPEDAVTDYLKGSLDAIILDENYLKNSIIELRGKREISLKKNEYAAIAFLKGKTLYYEEIKEALNKLSEDGTIENIKFKYRDDLK